MSAIFADSGQGITSLPTKIMSCVSIQVSVDCVSILPAQAEGYVWVCLGRGLLLLPVWCMTQVWSRM
jgi:hypothetical protein